VAALTAACAVLLVVGVTLVTWKWWEAEQAYQSEVEQRRIAQQKTLDEAEAKLAAQQAAKLADDQKKQAVDARNAMATALDKARRAQYAALFSKLARPWQEGGFLLDSTLMACSWDMCGWEWYFLKSSARTGNRGMTLYGHKAQVRYLAYSPDGKRLASGTFYGEVKVWDTYSGKLLANRDDKDGLRLLGLSFGPGGDELLLMFEAGLLLAWDHAGDKVVRTLPLPVASDVCAFCPDGRRVATATWSSKPQGTEQLAVWDTKTGHQLFHRQWPLDKHHYVKVGLSPGGNLVACDCAAGTGIRIWDVAADQELCMLHQKFASDLSFGQGGELLFTGDGGGAMRVWHSRTGTLVSAWPTTGDIQAGSLSPDGRRLATAGGEGVRVWDALTGQQLLHLASDARANSSCVMFSPDGQQLASGLFDGSVRVWATCPAREPFTLWGNFGIALSADGQWVATRPFDTKNEIKVSNAKTGEVAWSHFLTVDGPTVAHFAFSPDAKTVAGAGPEGVVVWETATGRELARLQKENWWATNIHFSGDGQRLLFVARTEGPDQNKDTETPIFTSAAVEVWDVGLQKRHLAVPLPVEAVERLAVSPDGKTFAFVTNGKVNSQVTWCNAATGAVLKTLNVKEKWPNVHLQTYFGADNRCLALICRFESSTILDVATGQKVLTLKTPDEATPYIKHVALSPDGRWLATAAEPDGPGETHAARMWDTKTGEQVLHFKVKGLVDDLAFCPDGKRLAVVSPRHIQFWNVEELMAAPLHAWEVKDLVETLFAEHPLREQVLEKLAQDKKIEPNVRADALALAKVYPEDAEQLYQAAWKLVHDLKADKKARALAVVYAEAACALAPKEAVYLAGLGAAHYRAGNYAKARVPLLAADKELFESWQPSLEVQNVLFLAMTHQQLGEKQEAQKAFAKAMKIHDERFTYTKDANVGALIQEAGKLIPAQVGK
jgi:WD40 repeat protein